MFDDNDWRNLRGEGPDKFLPYTAPRCSPATIMYILKTDLDSFKEMEIPQEMNFSTGGASYYRDTEGTYGGTACIAHFLNAPEIRDYLMTDNQYVNRAIKNNVTWFMPKEAQDIFVF